MKSPKTFLFLSIIVAVLVLGVAYAAISNVSLQVTGTAEAAPSDSNFKVAFKNNGSFVASNADKGLESITATVTFDEISEHSATITAKDFVQVGDTVVATLTVSNNSTDLIAELPKDKLTISGTNEYFQVTADLGSNEIAANGNTTVTVTIKLIKLPIAKNVTTTINVAFEAVPVNA